MGSDSAPGAISFDLFGTLVDVAYPSDPATVVATELETRGVAVPDDWSDAYAESHIDADPGTEVSLTEHVRAALTSRGVTVTPTDGEHGDVIRQAVGTAFDPDVETRSGATDAVDAAGDRGPVGILSNCSVSGLVHRTLARSKLDREAFDGVVTSVDCGWRKPDRRAFESVAAELDVHPSNLVHVGDDVRTDGGAADAGATAVLIDDVPLQRVPSLLEADEWPP